MGVFDFLGGGSSQKSSGTPIAPGTGVGGGVLGNIFGVPQTIERGQFKFKEGDVGEDFFGGFGQSILGLTRQPTGTSFQALTDLIQGQGQPVDVSALADARFTDLKEQFSGLGGLFGTDFQAAQGRNVLELDVAAQEAARQRQIQALGLSQGFNPFGFDAAGTEGGRELALFRALFGLQGTNPFSIGSDTTGKQSSGGGLLGIMGQIDQIFNPLSGGLSGSDVGGILGGASAVASSKELKNQTDEILPEEILNQLKQLDIVRWQYKPEVAKSLEDSAVHLGPYAEDFQKAFDLGNGREIAFIDIIGVALAATKGAVAKIDALEARISELEA